MTPAGPPAVRGEETGMGLIVTLVVGGIIGWLASIVMKTNAQMGLIANVVVGVIGSWLGAQIAAAAGLAVVGSVGSFIASLLGAIVLIWLLRVLGIFKA
jgi:uncharacterized membrane protein YeaQ/YmgE (transglycosylase-associated protein family)